MAAGAADAADDAERSGQRDNSGGQKRQRNTDHPHAARQCARALLNGSPHRLDSK